MAYSLGLTLYNLRPRRDIAVSSERLPRPAGRLVWLHAPSIDAARSIMELARRLVDDDGVVVLLTCPVTSPARAGVLHQPPPGDTPSEVRSFLDHWKPEVVVFAEGELRPALVHEAQERKLPMIVVNGRAPYILRERGGWFPGLMRSVMAGFTHVLTVDEAAARAFRKAGAPLSALTIAGRMEEESAALTYMEPERAALARQLATRPVWLAAALPEAEEAAVIAAHRAALRHAHRLLLIVVPQDMARADALAARMEAEGWAVAHRVRDEEPAADTEVFLADDAEYGLWYRLAPITFLGGSLSGDGCARNPLEPAALGSAILYGPRAGTYGATFGRLGSARAARAVGSAADLAEALAELLAPDRAARLAHAAWAVTSEGAEATDRAMGIIRRLMDGAG
jgi:3-deoxy-D-manno-octulosonic-acid transferase